MHAHTHHAHSPAVHHILHTPHLTTCTGHTHTLRLAEALAHMCDETMRRAAYIAYLVKSHQRFQGNKAQLTAALDLANR